MSTVVSVGGTLHVVDCNHYAHQLTTGQVTPAWVAARPIEAVFNDPHCRHLWRVRSPAPLQSMQLVGLRLAAAQAMKENAARGSLYERDLGEFVRSLLGMGNGSKQHYHCAEFAAHLRRAAGAWPAGESTSVTIPALAKRVGPVWEAVY